MPKGLSRAASRISKSYSNISMVESTFGTENYKYNEINTDDFFN